MLFRFAYSKCKEIQDTSQVGIYQFMYLFRLWRMTKETWNASTKVGEIHNKGISKGNDNNPSKLNQQSCHVGNYGGCYDKQFVDYVIHQHQASRSSVDSSYKRVRPLTKQAFNDRITFPQIVFQIKLLTCIPL